MCNARRGFIGRDSRVRGRGRVAPHRSYPSGSGGGAFKGIWKMPYRCPGAGSEMPGKLFQDLQLILNGLPGLSSTGLNHLLQ